MKIKLVIENDNIIRKGIEDVQYLLNENQIEKIIEVDPTEKWVTKPKNALLWDSKNNTVTIKSQDIIEKEKKIKELGMKYKSIFLEKSFEEFCAIDPDYQKELDDINKLKETI